MNSSSFWGSAPRTRSGPITNAPPGGSGGATPTVTSYASAAPPSARPMRSAVLLAEAGSFPSSADSPSGLAGIAEIEGDPEGEPPSWGPSSPASAALDTAHRFAETADASSVQDDPLFRGIGWVGGALIALLTVVVPLSSVLLDRQSPSIPSPILTSSPAG